MNGFDKLAGELFGKRMRLIAGIVSLSIVAAAGVSSSILVTKMIDEINRQKPAHEAVSYVGSTFAKNRRIFREYRRLYPQGKLITYAWTAIAAFAIGLVSAAICIGIIG